MYVCMYVRTIVLCEKIKNFVGRSKSNVGEIDFPDCVKCIICNGKDQSSKNFVEK